MKTLTPEFIAERQSAATTFCHAIRIEGAINVTDWNEELTIDGDVYQPGFPIEKPKLKQESGGTLKIGNTSDVFSSLLFNHQLNGKRCALLEIFFQDDFTIAGHEIVFDGVIDGPYINLGWAVLPVGVSRIEADAPTPRRRLMPACGFGFGFPSCGYTGPDAPCMKTKETCRNPPRFAGFRFIPPPGKKFVWGGRVYKVEG